MSFITKDRPIKIGIAGCGTIAKRHCQQLKAIGSNRVTVTALYDVKARTAQDYASSLQLAATCYSSFRGLLRSDVDAVLVLSPHPYHAEMAAEALQAGKHVYVEKPLATPRQWDSAQEVMQDALRRTSEQCLVIAPFERWPDVSQAMAFAQPEIIGRIIGGEANKFNQGPFNTWYYKKDTAHGGVIIDAAIYGVSRLSLLIGPVISVSASATVGGRFTHCWDGEVEADVEIFAHLNLTHLNSAHSKVRAGWWGFVDDQPLLEHGGEAQLDNHTIIGTTGEIRLAGAHEAGPPVLITTENRASALLAGTRHREDLEDNPEKHYFEPRVKLAQPDGRQMGYFLKCIQGREKPNLAHSFHIVEVLQGANDSLAAGGQEIEVKSVFSSPYFFKK